MNIPMKCVNEILYFYTADVRIGEIFYLQMYIICSLSVSILGTGACHQVTITYS